jgi:type I restriction enzyme R subunit
MQQALGYADALDVPFVFSSNGDAFLAHDRTGTRKPAEEEISLGHFPSPETLWQRYREWKGFDETTTRVFTQDYHSDASGKVDKHGEVIEDRIYNQRDFDRDLVLEQRTQLVARKVSDFLKATGRFDKTIVFCEDIDHAERMRQALVNENPDLAADNHRYVMRITGDNPEGKAELDHYIDPESRYPVIATTSKLMATGVDAQTCKLIVLDQRIESMTEFKQIIGRGTRINEDYGKYFFTIMDFKKATELFADPAFDGDPVQIYEPGPDEPPVPPDDGGDTIPPGDGDNGGTIIIDNWPPDGPGHVKYVVDDVPVYVVAERVQYYGKDGKLITESLKDYTRHRIADRYASLDDFLHHWSDAGQKRAIVHELEEQGVLLDALANQVGRGYDPFDLVCHVAFGRPPLTRRERAAQVRKRDYFTRYGDQARAVLDALLDKYADEGIESIEALDILRVQPFDRFGTPVEIIQRFGGKAQYLRALRELESQLYLAA